MTKVQKFILYFVLTLSILNSIPNFIKGIHYIKHDTKYIYNMVIK